MIRFYFTILLSLVLMGCSSDLPPMEETLADNRNVCTVTISETLAKALDEASSLRSRLYGISSSTRSNAKISIDPILSTNTRSESDTAYYIVNYGDNEGYAVVTTTEGLDKVWAISDEGSLHISDTTYNKGLSAFFDNLNYYSAAYSAFEPDTTLHDFQPSIRNSQSGRQKPLLAAMVRNWHQDSPYNMMCPDYLTEPKKVGCMALSAAQIMSYHNWPKNFEDTPLNWNYLIFNEPNLLYELLYKLGGKDYLKLNYYDIVVYNGNSIGYATTGYKENVIPCFTKLKYKNIKYRNNFSAISAIEDIKNNGPLLIYGTNGSSYYSGGHAWVIDGFDYNSYEQWEINRDGSNEYHWQFYGSYLFHCVWGEKTIGNGYYRWNNSYIGESGLEYRDIQDRKGDEAKAYNLTYFTNFQKNE